MDRLCGFGVLTGRDVVLRCPGSLSFTLGNYPTLCIYRRRRNSGV